LALGLPDAISSNRDLLDPLGTAGRSSRAQKARPKDEWVAVRVPAIISVEDFNRVQALLHSRRPNVTPPRIINSAVLLTGLARCESCGSPLMLTTGKSGRYRYYGCSANRLKGKNACRMPVSLPEDELDRLVLTALANQLITPERLTALLGEAVKHRREIASQSASKRTALKSILKTAETQIGRLLAAVADGTVPDMSLVRPKLDELTNQREECTRHLILLDENLPELRQVLSNQQAKSIAAVLTRRLLDAPKPLQRRYVRGLIESVVVSNKTAIISGPEAALAACASDPERLGKVPGFVREWCPQRESNSCFSLERAAS
jgi:site-specific DNA recombinase